MLQRNVIKAGMAGGYGASVCYPVATTHIRIFLWLYVLGNIFVHAVMQP